MRTTIICRGPSRQRFLSRLFNLFEKQRVPLLHFVSIRLKSSIWARFQIEATDVQIVRLRAKILGLQEVVECFELESASTLSVEQEIQDGLNALGIAACTTERAAPTFRGLQ